jgi:hypothetical protein
MKPEKLNITWNVSDIEQRQVDENHGPPGSNGENGNEMHIIFLYRPSLLRWTMWPTGLLFFLTKLWYKQLHVSVDMLQGHQHSFSWNP